MHAQMKTAKKIKAIRDAAAETVQHAEMTSKNIALTAANIDLVARNVELATSNAEKLGTILTQLREILEWINGTETTQGAKTKLAILEERVRRINDMFNIFLGILGGVLVAVLAYLLTVLLPLVVAHVSAAK